MWRRVTLPHVVGDPAFSHAALRSAPFATAFHMASSPGEGVRMSNSTCQRGTYQVSRGEQAFCRMIEAGGYQSAGAQAGRADRVCSVGHDSHCGLSICQPSPQAVRRQRALRNAPGILQNDSAEARQVCQLRDAAARARYPTASRTSWAVFSDGQRACLASA